MRVEEPGGPDAVSSSPDSPVYQVNIYKVVPESVGVPGYAPSYHVYEWKLHDTDVPEVLAWAEDRAGDNPYTVEVAPVPVDGVSHLLRLYGHDPNRGEVAEGCYVAAPDGVVPDAMALIREAKTRQERDQ